MLIPHAPLSPEWHEYRSTRITATRAVDILLEGVPEARTYRSGLDHWLVLTGQARDPDLDESGPLLWGRLTEEMHAKAAKRQTGSSAYRPARGIHQHEDIPWLCATTDGELVKDETEDEMGYALLDLELKAPTRFTIKEWFNELGEFRVPMSVELQARIGMACTGNRRAWVSCLFPPSAGEDIARGARIDWREETWEKCRKKLTRWYEKYVAADPPVPPPPPEHRPDDWMRAWGELHPEDSGETITASDILNTATERYRLIHGQEKALEDERNAIKALAMAELRTATWATTAHGTWAWKRDKNGKRGNPRLNK